MVRIAEAIKQANEHKRHFVSFEFIAPTTEAGIITLYDRIERLSTLDPLFCSITWGDRGQTAETSIEVASTCQSLLSVNYQVNLTGYTSEPEDMLRWLSLLKAKGVQNVLITRGATLSDGPSSSKPPSAAAHDGGPRGTDAGQASEPARAAAAASRGLTAERAGAPPAGTASGSAVSPAFPHAVDLVRFVRQHFGSYFCIAVVGFPEGEQTCSDSSDNNKAWTAQQQDAELQFLKEKVDAGADYIITHGIFNVEVFDRFCSQCRHRGIRCPILPGVLPVSQPRHLTSFGLRHLSGTAELRRRMDAAKGNDAEVRRVVVVFYQELVKQLLERGCGGVYFFTMNADQLLLSILKGIEVTTHRVFPWRPSENEERRRQETVRPVHWSSRVTSYMMRTARWKDATRDTWNPVAGSHHSNTLALGEASGYHARLLLRSRAKRCTQFLALRDMTEIEAALTELSRIFVAFLDGSGSLPWADELSGETAYVGEYLLKPLNARGLYTINSQPPVNGAPSSHKVVGWGPGDGYVYQKSYVEFFCPLTAAQTVFTTLEKYPSLQYMAMNSQGSMVRARWRMEGSEADAEALRPPEADVEAPLTSPMHSQNKLSLFGTGVTAVTWGVFPGREVIQPTIVSVDSFRAWVGEAFDLWAAPFPSNDVPAVVRYIQSEWVLVSVVDNSYQESPTPLEHAAVEICSKMPPLTPVDLSQLRRPATSLTSVAATAGGQERTAA